MKKILILLFAGLISLAGCTTNPADNTDKKLTVITSLFPQYDFVRNIAQDKVNVSLLLPPGVESHAFDPTPSQIISITQADLFVYTNAEMEPWIERIVENVDEQGPVVLESSQGIQLIDSDDEHHLDDDHDHDDHDDDHDDDDHDDDDHDHLYDPHVWLDPLNAKIMVNNIVAALKELDPENADFYQNNANDYLSQLDELNERFEEIFANTENNTIVYGGHFAFGYLANRFNLNILSPYTGFSPDSEPTANAIASLISTVNENNIKVIFFEELIEPRVANVIAEQTNTTAMLLHGAHNITKQEMDANITYLDIMFENADKIEEALSYE